MTGRTAILWSHYTGATGDRPVPSVHRMKYSVIWKFRNGNLWDEWIGGPTEAVPIPSASKISLTLRTKKMEQDSGFHRGLLASSVKLTVIYVRCASLDSTYLPCYASVRGSDRSQRPDFFASVPSGLERQDLRQCRRKVNGDPTHDGPGSSSMGVPKQLRLTV